MLCRKERSLWSWGKRQKAWKLAAIGFTRREIWVDFQDFWSNFLKIMCSEFGKNSVLAICRARGGGFSHWHGIRICACLLGHFFTKFGIAIGGFSSETKEPKLHKLGVFWANYCKKHPILSKLGAFLSKMVYWWVGNLAKNWYRDSQIFEVRQAHPRTILVKEPPPGFWSFIFLTETYFIDKWRM